MPVKIRGILITASCLSILACGGEGADPLEVLSVSDRISNPQHDVMAQISRSGGTPTPAAASENYILNGSFEADKSGWTSCSVAESSKISSDAQEGSKALEIAAGNCFYQSVHVTPGSSLNLNCYAKVADELRWTGMGLGFSDEKWTTLGESPTAVITSSDYTRYDVRATAPKNTKFVSMWLYSDSRSLVDNCVLTTNEYMELPPAPTSTNYLLNSSFDKTTNNMPNNWVNYCGGSASAGTVNGLAALEIGNGACVSQGIGAGALAAMQGKPVKLHCEFVYDSSRYAEVILNLDGKDYVTPIRANSNGKLDHLFTAPETLSTGFFSIYSETEKNSLRVDQCSLQLADTFIEQPSTSGPARIDVSNGLEGPDSWLASSPFNYAIKVTNTGAQLLSNVTISSDKIEDCIISYDTLAVGETKNDICTGLVPKSTATTPAITVSQFRSRNYISFSHVVTATATNENGQTVTDNDKSTNTPPRRLHTSQRINAIPNTYGASDGDTITFTVEVANTANSVLGDVLSVTSTIPDCNRVFSSAVTSGTLKRYTCTVRDITIPFTAEFETNVETPGAAPYHREKSVVNLLPVGTTGIEVRSLFDFLNVNSIDVENLSAPTMKLIIENTGAVDLHDINVNNDTFSGCIAETTRLKPRQTLEFDCEFELQNPIPTGSVVQSKTIVNSTSADGEQVSSTLDMRVFNKDDLELNINLAPTSGNAVVVLNEEKTIDITLKNTGQLAITELQSLEFGWAFTTYESNCQELLTELVQTPDLYIAPGDNKNIRCAVTASATSSQSSWPIRVDAKYGTDKLPGYLKDGRGEL